MFTVLRGGTLQVVVLETCHFIDTPDDVTHIDVTHIHITHIDNVYR